MPLALELDGKITPFAQDQSPAHMIFDSNQCNHSYVLTVLLTAVRPLLWIVTNRHIFKNKIRNIANICTFDMQHIICYLLEM